MTKEQIEVCNAVARHISVKKQTIKDEAEHYLKENENSPIIEFSSLKLLFATTKETLSIGKILLPKCFHKSDLYSVCVNLMDNYKVDFVAFYSGGALLVAHFVEEYAGLGGIFVKKPNAAIGIAIEPLAHYLNYKHPRAIED